MNGANATSDKESLLVSFFNKKILVDHYVRLKVPKTLKISVQCLKTTSFTADKTVSCLEITEGDITYYFIPNLLKYAPSFSNLSFELNVQQFSRGNILMDAVAFVDI